MMGYGEEEDFPMIVDIVPLVRYYVEPDFKGSQIKDEIFGLTNGLFSLALIKVNYLEFQLKEFVQSKQVKSSQHASKH